ncbi:MAG TPA: tRNA (adenosine(37)-N6)-dimethylallyltransferase MiaA [Propionibacteriaceae bacterium]|nr:tRNA (adenosine(37)-N6)-dimethylallyltransferase MiaA [Propionibacteriaceae bacterium]
MIVVLVGPTAVGKSALALAVASRLGSTGVPAEIVNADSMLVYRGMDIGTAKPSLAERAGVPHHLLDILDITDTATVAEFQRLARAAIADCRHRSVVPILVGGSALYVRAIVDDFEFPGTDPALRAQLEAELAAVGAERMHARLASGDPGAAAQIEPANGRRIVRAMEVGLLTGKPYNAQLPSRTYRLPGVTQIGLDLDRPSLDIRIAQRVQRMWAEGFVDEVRRLAAAGLRQGVTASRALGYRQVLQFLDGQISEEQAQDLTISATRRFARRQDSWFRKDERIRWLPALSPTLVDQAYALVGSHPGHESVGPAKA